MATDDYYARLQVSSDASQTEIKAAFRRLARRYHPDLNPNDPSAHQKFQALVEAYEVLTDQVMRQRYDHTGTAAYGGTRPQTAHDFYLRGIQRTLERQYEAALKDFDRVIALQPDLAEAYLRRVQMRYLLEDDPGVLADCQRLLQFSQPLPQTYYYLGLARYRLGYTESALAAFTQAIGQEPDDPQAYFQRGVAYADVQEWASATMDFQTASLRYQAQGDMDGYNRSCDRIRKLRKRQGLRNKFRKRTSPSPRPGLRGLSQVNQIIFGLLGNPAGELLSLYSQLSPGQALRTGCLLAMVGISGFTLAGYVMSFAGDVSRTIALSGLWLSSSTTFFSLIIALTFSRLWLQRRTSWASDTFIAGATLLPMGIFAFITPMAITVPWLWLLLLAMALHHTFLTLYTSCHQIHHYPDVVATWLTPSLLFIGLSMGYLMWAAWI